MYTPKIGEEVWCEVYDEYDSETFFGKVIDIGFGYSHSKVYEIEGKYDLSSCSGDTVCVDEFDIYKTKKELLEKKIKDNEGEIEHLKIRISLIQNEIKLLESRIGEE